MDTATMNLTPIELERHTNSMNREDGLILSKSWKPIICFLKNRDQSQTQHTVFPCYCADFNLLPHPLLSLVVTPTLLLGIIPTLPLVLGSLSLPTTSVTLDSCLPTYILKGPEEGISKDSGMSSVSIKLMLVNCPKNTILQI
jgi:hypothetical protein